MEGKKSIKIAPSILSADFSRLGEEVQDVISAGAEYIHFDVMDGVFVPNISIGIPVLKSLRGITDAVLDVHLMITEPGRYIDAFIEAGADILTLHLESEPPQAVMDDLKRIRALGKKAGLSLKPKTPASAIGPYIDVLDLVLVMTVEPGFGGQSFMEDQLPKISALRALIDGKNPACELEVDGGIGPLTAALVKAAGAGVLVAGSAVFGARDRAAAIKAIKEA